MVETVVLRPSLLVFVVCDAGRLDFAGVGDEAAAVESCTLIVDAVPLSSELPMVICLRVAENVKPFLLLGSWVLWRFWMTKLLILFRPV